MLLGEMEGERCPGRGRRRADGPGGRRRESVWVGWLARRVALEACWRHREAKQDCGALRCISMLEACWSLRLSSRPSQRTVRKIHQILGLCLVCAVLRQRMYIGSSIRSAHICAAICDEAFDSRCRLPILLRTVQGRIQKRHMRGAVSRFLSTYGTARVPRRVHVQRAQYVTQYGWSLAPRCFPMVDRICQRRTSPSHDGAGCV